MERRLRRQMLYKLTADDRGRHRGGVEPQPLLIDEPAALAEPLAILYQNRAAHGAGNRHGVGRELQRPHELARGGQLRTPEIGAGGNDVGGDQVAFPAIAEYRHQIGQHAVDRLDDPGKIEDREIGGDLQGGPAVRLF